MNLSWLLIIFDLTIQFSANMEVAVVLFVLLMFAFLFYVRMAPKESIWIIFTIIAFRFNVPYLLPILAGLYFPVTVIFAISVGVFLHAQIPALWQLMEPGGVNSVIGDLSDLEFADMVAELPEAFSEVYAAFVSGVSVTGGWLFAVVIFAMVVVLVHIVSRQSFNYSKEIAIGLGSGMMIFGFIFAGIMQDTNIGLMLIGVIVCAIIAVIVRFFDGVLDYSRAERVQFQDDENYYYVRIVPKIIIKSEETEEIEDETDEDDE